MGMLPSELASHALSRLATYGFSAVLGAEIECYVRLPERSVEHINLFFGPVIETVRHEGIALLRIEEERGPMQFELVLGTFEGYDGCVHALKRTRELIEERAGQLGIEASFAAKPYQDAQGSGLQFHLHLVHEGENAFHKTDDYISDALHYALGGLCEITPHVMPVLCPSGQGYSRFHDKDHVPSTVSWGSNNRSCALRIPYTPAWEDKRIEWRVPSADADPAMVAALMLHAVASGIDERMAPPLQTYGIASKEKDAISLPLTLEDALMHAALLPAGFTPLLASDILEWSNMAQAADKA